MAGTTQIVYCDGYAPTISGETFNYGVNLPIADALNVIYFIYDGYNIVVNTINITPIDAPVLAITEGDTQLVVDWGVVEYADNYILERDTDSGFATATEVYNGSNTEYTDTGLTNGTTYYYRVKAQGAGRNDSEWSATASDSPQAALDPDLLAWWDASDDSTVTNPDTSVTEWADKTANNNDLSEATNTPTHSQANDNITFAGVADTSSDHLSADIPEFYFQQADDFTVLIKGLKFENGSSGSAPQRVIDNKVSQANTSGWALNLATTGATLYFTLDDNTTQNFASWSIGGSDWDDGVERDIILMQEGGTLKFYDSTNTNVGTNGTTSISTISYGSAKFKLGVEQISLNSKSFNGSIKEIKVWDKALTSGERDTELGI